MPTGAIQDPQAIAYVNQLLSSSIPQASTHPQFLNGFHWSPGAELQSFDYAQDSYGLGAGSSNQGQGQGQGQGHQSPYPALTTSPVSYGSGYGPSTFSPVTAAQFSGLAAAAVGGTHSPISRTPQPHGAMGGGSGPSSPYRYHA